MAREVTAERFRELLDYDPQHGSLIWRHRAPETFKTRRAYSVWMARFAGKVAGIKGKDGYRRVCIDGSDWLAHRIAWAIAHNRNIVSMIDHINGDKDDNRLLNLREATRSQNGSNRPAPRNNTSGRKGVVWARRHKKWVAQIVVRGKYFHLGYFDDFDEASLAYESAAKNFFGEFARVAG